MTEVKSVKLDSNIITKNLLRWAQASTSEVVVPNYYIGWWECDVLKVSKAGVMYEYEVKTSRSDFFNDAKKSVGRRSKTMKHADLLAGLRVDRFYFVVPENLVRPEEVPAGFGLIYATFTPYAYNKHHVTFRIVKVSKLLRKGGGKANFQHLAANLSIKLANAKLRIR